MKTAVSIPDDVFEKAERLADAPANVLLPDRMTSVPKNSVANVSQVVALEVRH